MVFFCWFLILAFTMLLTIRSTAQPLAHSKVNQAFRNLNCCNTISNDSTLRIGKLSDRNQQALDSGTSTSIKMAFLIGAQKSGTTFLFQELLASHPRILSQVTRVPISRGSKHKKPPKSMRMNRILQNTPLLTISLANDTDGSTGDGQGGGSIRSSEKNGSDVNVMTRLVPGKEPHFFDRVEMGNLSEYMGKFHVERDPGATFMDATPDLIHVPASACRIAELFPDAKLLAVLRDPTQRALSNWNMVRHQGKSNIEAFNKEVEAEIRSLRAIGCSYESEDDLELTDDLNHVGCSFGGSQQQQKDLLVRVQDLMSDTAPDELVAGKVNGSLTTHGPPRSALPIHLLPRTASTAGRPSPVKWSRAKGMPGWNECYRCAFSYCADYHGPRETGSDDICPSGLGRSFLRRGHYAYQLEWWLEHFEPSQLLVIDYEELQSDPDTVVDRVIRFLDLDPNLRVKKARPSRGFATPYNGTDSAFPDTMRLLDRFYAHANRELCSLAAYLDAIRGAAPRR